MQIQELIDVTSKDFNEVVHHLTNSSSAFPADKYNLWSVQQKQYASQFLARMNFEYTKAIEITFDKPDIKDVLKEIGQEGIGSAVEATLQLLVDNLDTILDEVGKVFSSLGISLALLAVKSIWAYFRERKIRERCKAFVKPYLDSSLWNVQVHLLVESFTEHRRTRLPPGVKSSTLRDMIRNDVEACVKFIRKRKAPPNFNGDFDIAAMWMAGMIGYL